MATSTTEPSRPGPSVGTTTEFTLFFRIKPGHAPALREALETLQSTPGYLPGDLTGPSLYRLEEHWRSAVHPDRLEGTGAFNQDREPKFQDPDY